MTSSPAHNLNRTRGFTLAEMLVAVGLVALLTVGIGQVFQNISRLVGTGAAVAEVDQRARLIEQLLRQDFDALRGLRPEEYFVVIRNGRTDEVYLSSEARDADLRDGLAPGDPGSRAQARRIDEIGILVAGPGSGGFTSYQYNGNQGGNDVRAPWARIYYGHGLRPAPDLDFDPDNDRIPRRFMVPDGYFGQAPGADNERDPRGLANGGRVSAWGRNEFAGDWIMARQPLLLFGGTALGIDDDDGSVQPVGTRIEVAPYSRDFEIRQRFYRNGEAVDDGIINGGQSPQDFPNPRAVGQGRVDVCAQAIDDVRRWLEGQAENASNDEATAFSSGRYDTHAEPFAEVFPTVQDSPLYIRTTVNNNPELTVLRNTRRLLSAVAGTLQRPLCEDVAPSIDRGGPVDAFIEPEDAIMDLHASLASHCSSIEIAWSDGTTAHDEIDIDGDGEDDYFAGDIIWFDMDHTREDLELQFGSLYRAVPEHLRSEITSESDERNDLIRGTGGDSDRINQTFGGYDAFSTGGQGPNTFNQYNEYMAIWPFRRPTGDGRYGGAWPKPQLVRFRITLHDSLGRLPEGKTFEFIYSLAFQG